MSFCTIDTINSYLPAGSNTTGPAVEADDQNVQNIQISVDRVIRGYLSRILSYSTMATWTDPDNTPEIIQEISGMLCAAQLFFDQVAASSLDIEDRHVSQVLYDRAIAMLQEVVDGSIIIPDSPAETPETMDPLLDFFPVDDTDRAFTLSLEL